MTTALAQHTLGHVNCPACDASRFSAMSNHEFPSLNFEQASAEWIEERKLAISPRTLNDYQAYRRMLLPFFGALALKDIHIGHLREYQKARQSAEVGAVCINHELGALQQILRMAGLWAQIEPHYKTLRKPKAKTGHAISPEDEERLFLIASKRPRWKVAYWASSLSANTTAGPGEIRHLKVGDIDLDRKLLYVRAGVKNDFRIRKIPLNDRAFKMVCRLLERAHDLGATSQEDFLLPHRAMKRGQGWDFSRPMYSWYTAWRALTRAADMKLRPYDLRHHAITKLLENPDVSEETVKSIAGHVSPRILQTYSHIRMKAKEDALKALEQPSGRMQPVRMVPDWYFSKAKAVEKKAAGEGK